jgi:endonuclease III
VPDARAWLESLPGVGSKTSAPTLLFSRLRMPALPVDSHRHRVALRLGLLPQGTTVGPSHALPEALLPVAPSIPASATPSVPRLPAPGRRESYRSRPRP